MNKNKILAIIVFSFLISCTSLKKDKSLNVNVLKTNIFVFSDNIKNLACKNNICKDDRPIAFVVSAPSGCGKDTAINSLIEKHKELVKIISVTTRKIRTNEKNHYDYHFVSDKKFKKLDSQNKLAQKTTTYGQKRGILKSEIEEAFQKGKNVVFNVNNEGYQSIKAFVSNKFRIVSIFILPDSKEILLKRLTKRGTEKKSEIDYRMSLVNDAMKGFENYDYKVISGTIQETFDMIDAIYNTEQIKKNNNKSEKIGKSIINSKT